ncbi:DUF4139 domain-containing protein [Jannaschia seohaensis]|uniref:Uncharacterized protein (TIGR02231 family) n=1 Tax=Jannaschia seohaensis TaxID=475081 RepID=A0A2Y9AWU1_9RHOB|nr:DUF4139 domain-containing protein [Jannaschia seohaensis]PWJ16497.1 uncharacterized protein (TIGR02231 family) [Jannaschia seohaensis]SSA48734.1 conserved hypothetical protein [Jannaschia seohaensis]
MRLALLLCALPGLACAEDILLPAPVTEAQIHLRGAVLTRQAEARLPAGTHRLLVPVLPRSVEMPRIALTGASLGIVSTLDGALVDGRDLYTDRQNAAADALDAAEAARASAEDARLLARTDLDAAEARLAFLRSVSGQALSGLDAGSIASSAAAIGGGIAEAQADLAGARAALRAADDAVAEARRTEAQARRDADRAGIGDAPVSLLAIGLTTEGGPVSVTLEDVSDAAGWSPSYRADLTDGTVTLDRRAELWNGTGVAMERTALTLSTADLFAFAEPSEPYADRVVTQPETTFAPRSPVEQSAEADGGGALSQDFAPAPTVAQDKALMAEALLDGVVVTYAYPEPISLPAASGTTTVVLDRLDFPARVFDRAVPRYDETAYRMAEIVNATGEPLLPGSVTLRRDGAPVGQTELPLIPAGDTADLPFGPQPHLRLEWRALENTAGERGVFTTQGTRRQDVVLRVRNLSETAQTVETLHALPFSERDAVQVTARTIPAPDARDVEDIRGLARWDLDVAPGETAEITIRVEIDWPEGEVLNWQP